ncbi:MAG TPA: hypothetical protein VJ691_14170 [Vicinamibacterales bacterium]|nr:hypothetical protein [Vicinamibacterales bacterium]
MAIMLTIGIGLLVAGVLVALIGAMGFAKIQEKRMSVEQSYESAAASGEAEMSIDELKKAWRNGAWRHDPYWQSVYTFCAGFALIVVGFLSTSVALALR